MVQQPAEPPADDSLSESAGGWPAWYRPGSWLPRTPDRPGPATPQGRSEGAVLDRGLGGSARAARGRWPGCGGRTRKAPGRR